MTVPSPSAAIPSSHASTCNIAAKLPEVAELQPDTTAIAYPLRSRAPDGTREYASYTCAELDRESDVIAAGLEAHGIGRGVRTVLMVKPSLEFFALTFAIFKAGAVPVVVDPGIGLSSLKTCLAEAEPEAFIGIPAAHAARALFGWSRGTITRLVTVGRRWFWGGATLEQVKAKGRERLPYQMARTTPDDVAAILFTSGSTGIPKGVVYRHGNFVAQVEMIRRTYDIRPGEIDLPTFPLFALFDPALGMTTVVPDMDPRKPAEVDPAKLVEAIRQWGVTNMFGSPALLNTVSRWGAERGVSLPTLNRVISAGAPVPATVMERVHTMLGDQAAIHTPYGATESLPVATISSREVLSDTRARTDEGAGVCVGRPVEDADVCVIRITDEPIPTWDGAEVLEADVVGEIVVAGPMVTREYHGRETSTRLAKIADPSVPGGVRHRMGDLGYFDETRRLWFCGRKSQRVVLADRTLFTVPCEAPFNTHAAVYRSALVGVDVGGERVPLVCVELEPGVRASGSLEEELREIAERHDHTRGITRFLVHPGFPVDIRHNAKIGRETLSRWAQERVR